jgi:hypothetical protein
VYQTQSPINIPLNEGTCASVVVTSGFDATNNLPKTIIDSRGYNACDGSGLPKVNSRTVERALRLTYN